MANANDYRDKVRGTVWLPVAGVEARVRRIRIATLAANGEIPLTLQALAEDFVNDPDKAITLAEFPQYADVINMIVKAAMIEPRVGNEATDNCLDVHEMEFEDRIAVFQFVNAAADRMRPFRAEQAANVAGLSDGDGVHAAPVAAPAD